MICGKTAQEQYGYFPFQQSHLLKGNIAKKSEINICD